MRMKAFSARFGQTVFFIGALFSSNASGQSLKLIAKFEPGSGRCRAL